MILPGIAGALSETAQGTHRTKLISSSSCPVFIGFCNDLVFCVSDMFNRNADKYDNAIGYTSEKFEHLGAADGTVLRSERAI